MKKPLLSKPLLSKSIDIVSVISAISTIVSSVEVLFRKKKRQGPRKRARAIHRLEQVLPGVDIEPLLPILDLIAMNTSLLGSGHKDAVAEIAAVYSVIVDQVQMVDKLGRGDLDAREDLIAWLNDAIDLPVLSEDMEAFVLGTLIDIVTKELQG
jgi:hypothetical protein